MMGSGSTLRQLGRWLLALVGVTLVLDWALPILANLAIQVLPIAIIVVGFVSLLALVVWTVRRWGGGGW